MDSVNLIENIISLQGEGCDTGRRMLLCRFKLCNRHCEWCDTLVKMRVEQEGLYTLEQLQKNIDEYKLGLLITGGEPTFGKNLEQTILMLNKLNYSIANIETNGYNLPLLISKINKSKNVDYSWSPKLFNQKDLSEALKIVEDVKCYNNVFIKIVYENRIEVTEFLKYITDILNLNDRVYLMPKGITLQELLVNAPKVFDVIEEYKINFSSREHIVYNFI